MNQHSYLLDTNIISALIREPQGPVLKKLEAKLPATACTSIIVAAEIHFGLCKNTSKKLKIQAEKILAGLDILPLDPPTEKIYGEIRAHLHKIGQPIGYNDLFIAAHARALDLILVTANLKEFKRVPKLKVENWL